MAVHTYIKTRDRSMARNFNAGVTVFAVDLILPSMQLMGKRQRLVRHVALVVTNHDFIFCQRPYKNAQATKTHYNERTEELFHCQTLCINIQSCSVTAQILC